MTWPYTLQFFAGRFHSDPAREQKFPWKLPNWCINPMDDHQTVSPLECQGWGRAKKGPRFGSFCFKSIQFPNEFPNAPHHRLTFLMGTFWPWRQDLRTPPRMRTWKWGSKSSKEYLDYYILLHILISFLNGYIRIDKCFSGEPTWRF